MSAAPRAVPPAVNSWNAEYLEDQYRGFKADPASVPADLRSFFQGFDLAQAGTRGPAPGPGAAESSGLAETLRLQYAASSLIDSYRRRGHLASRLDPFGNERGRPPVLTLEHHGLTEADLDKAVNTGSLPIPDTATLRDAIAFLERTYCGTIGAEIMHVSDSDERAWLVERCERHGGGIPLTRGERVHILEQLIRSEQFEKFLGKRYATEKRFSLEGGESLIPLLDRVIEGGAALGVEEIVFGMPHRGRLNVLNNIVGKTYEQIFTEFEDNWEAGFADGGGDVKYHRGYSGDRAMRDGSVMRLTMTSNPSHLESVDGVVEGRCRAKQRLRTDRERRRVIPLLMHGDAAVIAQGVVAEVLNYSQLEGYTTGGTIHAVVNNQVGFTTGPEDARSSRYCTDIGMMIETPVFHVNGDDPEAVVAVAQFAVEYRQKFRKDLFIDMWCFRRYGHNETDEASFTQPLLAERIRQKPSVLKVYAERLLADGVITDADMDAIRARLDDALEAAQAAVKVTPSGPTIDPGSWRWEGFGGTYSHDPAETAVPAETIREVCAALGRVPEGFNLNPKLKKLLEARAALPNTSQISYADAESIAIGTLLLEGYGVRLSGQDSRRGTFSHRHAVLRDFLTGEAHIPLNTMRPISESPLDAGKPGPDGCPTQGRFCVYDSPLSEAGVMAFDYGYSLADPRMLVMWEAQFGDFVNGAQVIIDQYLASAELKWGRWSGLTLLLPHGYEGAGPEHSSARLERFLQLCGNNNLQVVNPTTAAQIFHLLRRQMHRPFRKPLIVMTPKSMLREPAGTIDELSRGGFREILDDPRFSAPAADRSRVSRVLLCSGKVYFDLAAKREALGADDTAIIRFEQLYPFHADMARDILARYPRGTPITWVQEEPRNMGAYLFIADRLREDLGLSVSCTARPPSATPAVGSKSKDKLQQKAVLAAAMGKPADAPHPPENGVAATDARNGAGPGKAASPKKAAARR